jgi:hypothetical protein
MLLHVTNHHLFFISQQPLLGQNSSNISGNLPAKFPLK